VPNVLGRRVLVHFRFGTDCGLTQPVIQTSSDCILRILAQMTRGGLVVAFVWMLSTVVVGERPAQLKSTLSFENEDFAVVPLDDLRNSTLSGKPLSGLLVVRGYSGPIGATNTAGVWKLSAKMGGSQEGAEDYYWADSANANRLASFTAGSRGFLVVSKAGERLNTKLFTVDWPDTFRESVGYDVQAIAGLVVGSEHGNHPGKTEQDRARAGLEDLSFKSNWISSSVASPLVAVTARTVGRSGTVVQHCTVWYVPLAWADDKQHWKRFDQFSSPTSQSIPVGQYKIWANHNGQDGAKSQVDPGDDHKTTKNIDLDVP